LRVLEELEQRFFLKAVMYILEFVSIQLVRWDFAQSMLRLQQ